MFARRKRRVGEREGGVGDDAGGVSVSVAAVVYVAVSEVLPRVVGESTLVGPLVATVSQLAVPIAGLLLIPAVASAFREVRRRRSAGKDDATVTNATVLKMTSAGVAPQVIVAMIQSSSATEFDVGVEGLMDLTAKGVADDVISTMVKAERGDG